MLRLGATPGTWALTATRNVKSIIILLLLKHNAQLQRVRKSAKASHFLERQTLTADYKN